MFLKITSSLLLLIIILDQCEAIFRTPRIFSEVGRTVSTTSVRSAWFVRQKMGAKMEFSNGELILVVETDSGSSKPVVRLSVVPLKTEEVAKNIQYRLQGKSVAPPVRRGREGNKSFLALSSSSSASQCHCPCMGLSSSNCLARIILAVALVLHVRNLNSLNNVLPWL